MDEKNVLIINNDEESYNMIYDEYFNYNREEEELISYSEQIHLADKLELLKKDLSHQNINKKFENFLKKEDLLKRDINEEKVNRCNSIMFHGTAMIFSTIFLIGIFQLISLKKALWDLLKESGSKYIDCTFKKNCTIYDNSSNITNFTVNIINNDTNIIVYEFYDYFHNSSLTETIDFNLMMITRLIGDSLLKCIGFGYYLFSILGPFFGYFLLNLNLVKKEYLTTA